MLMYWLLKFFSTVCLLLAFCYSHGQTTTDLEKQKDTLNKRSIIKGSFYKINKSDAFAAVNQSSHFGLFHDNYFVSGIPTNKKISKNTIDAKFQVSIQQRIIKGDLPLNSFLFLTYTQKAFWSIGKESKPFTDNNFNPGVSMSSLLLLDSKLRGIFVLSIEHESNGRDSIQSRSWNYTALSYTHFYNIWFSSQVKMWGGWIDEKNNHDLLTYKGYGLVALNYQSKSDSLWVSLILNPTNRLNNCNTTVEVNFKTGPNVNQFLFLQYYSGFGENMLDYSNYTSMVRVGICIKPSVRNFY